MNGSGRRKQDPADPGPGGDQLLQSLIGPKPAESTFKDDLPPDPATGELCVQFKQDGVFLEIERLPRDRANDADRWAGRGQARISLDGEPGSVAFLDHDHAFGRQLRHCRPDRGTTHPEATGELVLSRQLGTHLPVANRLAQNVGCLVGHTDPGQAQKVDLRRSIHVNIFSKIVTLSIGFSPALLKNTGGCFRRLPGQSPTKFMQQRTSGLAPFVRAAGLALILGLILPARSAETNATPAPAGPEVTLDAAGRSSGATGALSGRIKNIVTDRYLNNVRVSIRDTDRVAFTDQSGTYLLSHVPPGEVVVQILFTGLDPLQATLSVVRGQTTHYDVGMTSRKLYGDPAEVVKLDAFVTSSARETNAEAIAVNEQRFAPNIKNVVSPDAYGDIIGGNVGDFLRYLPGVMSADSGSSPEPTAISLRGFASNFSGFSIDGAKVANANSAGNGRAFELNQSSIASIARVEVTKYPPRPTRPIRWRARSTW